MAVYATCVRTRLKAECAASSDRSAYDCASTSAGPAARRRTSVILSYPATRLAVHNGFLVAPGTVKRQRHRLCVLRVHGDMNEDHARPHTPLHVTLARSPALGWDKQGEGTHRHATPTTTQGQRAREPKRRARPQHNMIAQHDTTPQATTKSAQCCLGAPYIFEPKREPAALWFPASTARRTWTGMTATKAESIKRA